MHRLVKHLQFSLANALRATAWLCVFVGSFSFLLRHSHHDRFPWPQWVTLWLFLSLSFLSAWSPIVAVGALFGQTKRGMVVGLVLAVLYLLVACTIFPPTVR